MCEPKCSTREHRCRLGPSSPRGHGRARREPNSHSSEGLLALASSSGSPFPGSSPSGLFCLRRRLQWRGPRRIHTGFPLLRRATSRRTRGAARNMFAPRSEGLAVRSRTPSARPRNLSERNRADALLITARVRCLRKGSNHAKRIGSQRNFRAPRGVRLGIRGRLQ